MDSHTDRDSSHNTIIQEKDQLGYVINRYNKGRMLGKGGFAKCYEFIDLKTNIKYAAKIVQKASLTRSKAKQKLASQIKIHSTIKSEYVVKYQRFFEDAQYVYIMLELCCNQTLNELIKRRKRITQIQAKYYLHQLALGIKDIHSEGIIHRDLKLGNLFINEKLQIKIGDFGLAAKVAGKHQKRKTMCGTPNYIAPQILDNINGHSFQVDIWSLGVIAYAFVVGRPPFQTNDVKTTYTKIKNCNYSFPQQIPLTDITKNFISKMLQRDPKHRATIEEVINDQFFTAALFPKTLPMSTLACPPNANFLKQFQNPSLTKRSSRESSIVNQIESTNDGLKTDRNLIRNDSRKMLVRANSVQQVTNNQVKRAASTAALIKGQNTNLNRAQTKLNQINKYGPFVWVMYSQQNPKFGVSYILNSNAIGMRYNDSTCLISNTQFTKLKYYDSLLARTNPAIMEQVYDIDRIPSELSKKYKIIDYYQKHLLTKKRQQEGKMCNQQIIQKQKLRFRESTATCLQTYVVKYYKNANVTIFWFNNKDCQLIFKDSTQLLMSKEHVTYVNKVGTRKYFQKEDVAFESQQIKKRMKYASTIMETIKQSHNNNIEFNNQQNQNSNRPQNLNLQKKSSNSSTGSSGIALKLVRSSSVHKIQKVQKCKMPLRGSASTNKLVANKFYQR